MKVKEGFYKKGRMGHSMVSFAYLAEAFYHEFSQRLL